MEESHIIPVFENQTVFITGGTGFLGKILIEKLLRVCNVKNLCILLREKKGKTVIQRKEEFFEFACFNSLKKNNLLKKEKITFLSGDCTKENLGLSPEDHKFVLNNTNIIIHAAATVKFDDPLYICGPINIGGCITMLEMAKNMSKLKGFLYVSTAYSNCLNKTIKEDVYPPPMDAKMFLKMIESNNKEVIDDMTQRLLGPWPNTYIYTKSIAENYIYTEGKGLPLGIIRPAITISTYEEPLIGWVDNVYGPTGVTVAAGLGVLRTLLGDPKCRMELVPCDFVSNLIMATVYDIVVNKYPEPKFYNLVTNSTTNALIWRNYIDMMEVTYWDYVPSKVVWAYLFKMRKNEFWNKICWFLYHTCVAYFADAVLFCIGRKPIAVKTYQRLDKAMSLISYFTVREWNFENTNTTNLLKTLSKFDRQHFNFDMDKIVWPKYFKDISYGTRLHLLKEPLDNLPQARRKAFMLLILHYVFLALIYYIIFKLGLAFINLFI